MAAKKRKMSAAQKAALAKGRKAAAAKRRKSTKKATPAKKKTARKKAVRKPIKKRSSPPMAKKKRSSAKKKGPSKTRRVARRAKGLVGGVMPMMTDAALAVAGGVAAGFLANKVPIADPRIKAALPIVAGLGISMTVGKKNKMAEGIAKGMVILGTVAVVKQFAPNVPMLAGEDDYDSLPYYNDPEMLGMEVDDFDDLDDDMMGGPVQIAADEPYYSPADL